MPFSDCFGPPAWSDGGVPWSAYGDDGREGQAAMNRPQFLTLLASTWLPALPDVHARLSTGPARVADLCCGEGWSSIALALGYPELRVDGFDADTQTYMVDWPKNRRLPAVAAKPTEHGAKVSATTAKDGTTVLTVRSPNG